MHFCLEPLNCEPGAIAELTPIDGCIQFLWIRSGQGRLDLEAVDDVRPNQLICVNSACLLIPREAIRGVRLNVDREFLPDSSGLAIPKTFRDFLKWLCRNTVSMPLSKGAQAEVERLLDRVTQEDRSRQELFWISARLMVDEFLLLCYREWTLAGSEHGRFSTTAKDVVFELRNYIDSYYCEPISLQRLSEHAGYSPSYLSSMFHKITGQCVVEYITNKRIDHAKYLLATSGLKVVEIGLSSGFKDLAHFNRTFRRMVGTTPSRYRQETMTDRPRPVLVEAARPSATPKAAIRGLRQFFVPVTLGGAPPTTIAC